MQSYSTQDARMSYRLPRELREELEARAAEDRRSTSYLTRVAVEEYLERRRTTARRRSVRASAGDERS